ncbi:cysteine ABC transporter substrate-binding protein [Aedoeadaptatus acetigenes]|uniref:cysteine ABC transporter substrate-binding protein n=1 Tax=Aedoeadaptatus acetigenes TaxID=2981723 RepID=UPI0011DE4088|nr:cysteine ABC transporter substrate-binding protein [Aedoeadaptatus acetigenes]MCU6786880.1 cysteine ABC transporter substrate-binding protein [Aedoeadaptatus acetigenes]
MKKLLTVLMIATLALGLVACGGAEEEGAPAADKAGVRTVDEIKKSGEITIGVFGDKKPFGYMDEKGQFKGYDIALGDRIGEELGVKVKYIPVEAASRVEYLNANKIDLLLANFTVTDERKEQVDFALPYMKVSLGVVSPKGEITDVSQLKDKTLIISKGTTAETYFTEKHPEVKLQKYDQYAEAYSALLDGRGDAMSTDNTEVLAWALENDGYDVGIKTLGDVDYIAPAVKKGNKEMLDCVNGIIEKLYGEKFFIKAFEDTLAPTYGDAAKAEDMVVEEKPADF